jgi:hypothetical protein
MMNDSELFYQKTICELSVFICGKKSFKLVHDRFSFCRFQFFFQALPLIQIGVFAVKP